MTDLATRPFRHLLIDLDGTLLGSRDLPLRMEFVARTLFSWKSHGGWFRALQALSQIQRELQVPCANLSNQERAYRSFSEAIGVPEIDGGRILKTTVDEIFPRLERYFFPIPGAKDFLEWAKPRFPLTLATNPVWPENLVKMRLDWAGIDPLSFESITHAEKMHACKPSPEYYREVLEQGGLDPQECLLVGDDFRKDLPATEVGISVFILSKQRETVSVPAAIAKKKPLAPAWMGTFSALRAFLGREGMA